MPRETQDILQSLHEIQRLIPPIENFTGDVETDLKSPNLFKELCRYSIRNFEQGAKVKITLDGTVYAELRCDEAKPKHPYCYPTQPLQCTTLSVVRYNDIGEQLAEYPPDAIDMLLTVTLKALKLKHTHDDIESMKILSTYLFAKIRDDSKHWNPLSLLAVLIGSAACETGRGVVGYVNVVAAFHHLKHDARARWNAWASDTAIPDSNINDVMKGAKQITVGDTKAIATAVGGSNTYIKQHSGNIDKTDKTTKSWLKNKEANSTFASLMTRDLALMSDWKPRDYPFTQHKKSPDEKAGDIFDRKINHYLKLIFAHS
jgi:hypothetical protein